MTTEEWNDKPTGCRQGVTMNDPLPTLEWPDGNPPASWWGRNRTGKLTKVYRSYEDYCDD
jgi:hypothetical protein